MAKLHSASPRAIFAILTTTLMKFIPNFTPSHAITYTNKLLFDIKSKVIGSMKQNKYDICKFGVKMVYSPLNMMEAKIRL